MKTAVGQEKRLKFCLNLSTYGALVQPQTYLNSSKPPILELPRKMSDWLCTWNIITKNEVSAYELEQRGQLAARDRDRL